MCQQYCRECAWWMFLTAPCITFITPFYLTATLTADKDTNKQLVNQCISQNLYHRGTGKISHNPSLPPMVPSQTDNICSPYVLAFWLVQFTGLTWPLSCFVSIPAPVPSGDASVVAQASIHRILIPLNGGNTHENKTRVLGELLHLIKAVVNMDM